jgi:hypothetical protein
MPISGQAAAIRSRDTMFFPARLLLPRAIPRLGLRSSSGLAIRLGVNYVTYSMTH